MQNWPPLIFFILTGCYGETSSLPVSDAEDNVTNRDLTAFVMGGSPDHMPTAVAIFIRVDYSQYPQPWCSGTILSEEIVLSAAHCVFDKNGTNIDVDNFLILAGESNLRQYLMGDENLVQELNVTDVIIHPHYKHINDVPGEQDELIWDLAILKLSSNISIKTNSRVQVALLPPPGLIHAGKEIKVGGWGKYTVSFSASVKLRAINITINSDMKCFETFGCGKFIPSQMFCAGKKGLTTCSGDSGAGGLIYTGFNKPIIVGVLSFGVKDCSTAAAFQRVEKSLPWIYKETKLRPAYGVFEDETIYEDFLQDTKKTFTPKGPSIWMDWGDNPDLVEESDTIQGREHIKLMVLMVGETIDLECQVACTSEPVSPIRWKINGKKEEKDDDPKTYDYSGEVFVEDHLNLNITEDMDSSTVSCEYSKGQYGASVEAVLRVFKLETREEYKCGDCNVSLTYKEVKRSSPAENSVDKRLKAKIKEIANVVESEIKVDSSGYSVNLPLVTVLAKNLIPRDYDMLKKLEKCQEKDEIYKKRRKNFNLYSNQRIPRSFK